VKGSRHLKLSNGTQDKAMEEGETKTHNSLSI